jgi:hypothetical protein
VLNSLYVEESRCCVHYCTVYEGDSECCVHYIEESLATVCTTCRIVWLQCTLYVEESGSYHSGFCVYNMQMNLDAVYNI